MIDLNKMVYMPFINNFKEVDKMPLIKKSTLRSLGQHETLHKSFASKQQEILTEQATMQSFDIFLSHAFMDKEIIIGLRKYLMLYGYTVYIDWIDDEALDRSAVNHSTAGTLKNRMEQSKCLLYATTENYRVSKWMPWELGYFDGKNGKVAVLPVVDSDTQDYSGVEYLGLYKYISNINNTLWLKDSNGIVSTFSTWLRS